MRLLVVNTDYPEFLRWFYAEHPGLERRSYSEQMQTRMEEVFGVADFYSRNLRKLGHQAWDIHANNEFMQRAWAAEHGLRLPSDRSPRARLLRASRSIQRRKRTQWLRGLVFPQTVLDNAIRREWMTEILAAQIKHYQPDVLLNQAMDVISPGVIRDSKRHVGMLAGQIASPLPEGQDFSHYDLVLSSLPSLVDHFRGLGISSEFHRFSGFDPTVLSRLGDGSKTIDISFVGSLTRLHASRIRLLEQLCRLPAFQLWGPGVDGLPADSPIRDRYQGEAWGLEMYRILRRSRVTVNKHPEIAGQYAANMRLYEATGVGTLLITDWKKNLGEIFEPGKELVAYRSPEECMALIQYYLENERERDSIAYAGQQRTLKENTYESRMRELVQILEKYT